MDDQTFLNQLAEKLSKLGTVRPLGFHYLHPYGTVPADSIICNGATYSRALYKDFFDYITTQGWVKTEAEWQEIAKRSNGFCPFYSEGNGSTNFRTPKFAPYQQVAITSTSAGAYRRAGLPEISGTISAQSSDESKNENTGVFYTITKGKIDGGASGGNDYAIKVGFKASGSNAIYGRSTTVQPESHEWMVCVVVAGQATNLGSVDMTDVLTTVAQVQADVGVIPRPNAYVTQTWSSGTSWYRKYSDGWIEQGGEFTKNQDTNITVTFPVAFRNTNYTIATSQYAQQTSNSPRCSFTAKTNTGITHNYGSWGSKWGWFACGY